MRRINGTIPLRTDTQVRTNQIAIDGLVLDMQRLSQDLILFRTARWLLRSRPHSNALGIKGHVMISRSHALDSDIKA